jgi:SulP family sulfate permease
MQLITGLHFNNIRGDIYGGIVAAVVALPLALAFGVASGVGAIAGLYGAILVGFFAAVFGGTPAQCSGPTGPMTVVMAGILVQFSDEPALAFTAVILGGGLHFLHPQSQPLRIKWRSPVTIGRSAPSLAIDRS